MHTKSQPKLVFSLLYSIVCAYFDCMYIIIPAARMEAVKDCKDRLVAYSPYDDSLTSTSLQDLLVCLVQYWAN